MRARRHSEQGGTLVELALMMPFLLFLGLGIGDVARVFYYSVAVTNAARSGAQYGIMQHYTDLAGIKAAAATDANISGFTASNVAVTTTCTDGTNTYQYGTSNWANCLTMIRPAVYVDVQATYSFTTIFDYSKLNPVLRSNFSNTITLTRQAKIRAQ